MSAPGGLTDAQLARLTAVGVVLLPGGPGDPGPGELPDYDRLLQQASTAFTREWDAVVQAVDGLPAEITWDGLAAHAAAQPESFELVSLIVAGAFTMSPDVLASLGVPTRRRRAPHDQAAEELGTGILDAVLERGSPVATLEDIERAEHVGSPPPR